MFKLYGNGTVMGEFETKEETKKAKKEFKEIERAMFNISKIKFEIVEEV